MSESKISLLDISLTFLLIGTIGFGGGMAIIALMQEYCVERKKWLSLDDFLHGVALGQFMGPFALNSAIFVGYITRGIWGGVCAALSFLMPSVILIVVLSSLYDSFRDFSVFKSALNGVAPVVVALIISAAISMGKTKVKSVESVLMIIISMLLMLVFKIQIVLILLLAFIYALLKNKFFQVEIDKRED